MYMQRNGEGPRIHPTAKIAPGARIVGNVSIGARCYVDYGAVIASGGAPIRLDDHVIVLANSVIRSVGGAHRPAFPVRIGERSLISPLCALAGCAIGRGCYVATGAMIFQGAVIGDNSRIAAGAIVHVRTNLPPGTHIGLRHIAAPTADGFVTAANPEVIRPHLATADFFSTVFAAADVDIETLHQNVMDTLAQEIFGWVDRPVSQPEPE